MITTPVARRTGTADVRHDAGPTDRHPPPPCRLAAPPHPPTSTPPTRTDRKPVPPPPDLLTAVHSFHRQSPGPGEPVRVLDIGGARSFAYRSTYFDTPGLFSYHQAAGPGPPFKVRTRATSPPGRWRIPDGQGPHRLPPDANAT